MDFVEISIYNDSASMNNLSESAQQGRQSLKEFQKLFNPHIEAYLKRMQEKIHGEFDMDITKKAFDVFVDYATRDCKRLRASFVHFTHKMYGNPNEEAAIQAGIVIELEHAHLLMIDDYMDRSEFRRGGISAHREFENYYKEANYKGAELDHFGNSISVNASLVGGYLGQHLITELKVPDSVKVRFLENLDRNLIVTGIGQITDITNAYKPDVTENEVLKMLKWKTGVYTYENPIQTGAILANASDEELNKLAEFAIPGGIAFQLQDDILGMFGDSEVMGKSAMDDLMEGKYTLLVHNALKNGSKEQVEFLRKCLGNKNINKDDHEKVKQIITECGALEYTRNKALELTKQAKESLTNYADKAQLNNEGLDYLLNISDFVIERQK